jgi:hypothetical protein
MADTWGPNRPAPRLLASLPCEDVSTSVGLGDDRISLQRVFFVLYADEFPAAYDRLVVANLWIGGEGAYKETVRVVAPDGTVAAQGEAELNAQPNEDQAPQVPTTMNQLCYFPALVLPEAGEYTVELAIDGAVVHTYALHVVALSEAGEEEQGGSDQQS